MNKVSKFFSFFLVGLTLFWVLVSGHLNLPSLTIFDQSAWAQIPTVTVKQLPPEAQRTLNLIDRGGPFPYKKDGTVFQNRERRLPNKPVGYYREYTVPTPGASNRGARRLVVGQGKETYYTNDHYRSFMRVIR